jgi:hypothetical protein
VPEIIVLKYDKVLKLKEALVSPFSTARQQGSSNPFQEQLLCMANQHWRASQTDKRSPAYPVVSGNRYL